MLRGQQQQVEKNQYEEHLDQLRAEQGQLNKHLDAHFNAHINAQFDAQKALGAMNTQSVKNVYYAGKDEEPPINLEEGVWAASITELENLWLVKFSSKWVQHHELDEFYKVAVLRLINAKKMETHHLTQISLPVYRIIE
jgi:hypothetical protein